MGFDIRIPPEIFLRQGYLAGPDPARIRVWADLSGQNGLDGLMAARGGYGALRILDQIPTRPLRDHPRLVIGFSDITALLLHLYRTLGLVTLHGPVVTSLAEADPLTLDHFYRLITGKKVFPLALDDAAVLVPGRAEGPLVGGNLTLIVHLAAARRLPNLDGSILFLEDVDEAPYRLDRHLTSLKLAGLLDRVRGVILGQFVRCGDPDQVTRLMTDFFQGFPGPVVLNFPIGHGERNLALPIGPRAALDTRAGTLDLLEPWLAE